MGPKVALDQTTILSMQVLELPQKRNTAFTRFEYFINQSELIISGAEQCVSKRLLIVIEV